MVRFLWASKENERHFSFPFFFFILEKSPFKFPLFQRGNKREVLFSFFSTTFTLLAILSAVLAPVPLCCRNHRCSLSLSYGCSRGLSTSALSCIYDLQTLSSHTLCMPRAALKVHQNRPDARRTRARQRRRTLLCRPRKRGSRRTCPCRRS